MLGLIGALGALMASAALPTLFDGKSASSTDDDDAPPKDTAEAGSGDSALTAEAVGDTESLGAAPPTSTEGVPEDATQGEPDGNGALAADDGEEPFPAEALPDDDPQAPLSAGPDTTEADDPLSGEDDPAVLLDDDALGPGDDDALEPSDDAALEPSDDGALEPSDDGALEPSDDGALEPSDDGALEPSDDGALEPSDDGALEPSDDGALEPSDDGAPRLADGTLAGSKSSEATAPAAKDDDALALDAPDPSQDETGDDGVDVNADAPLQDEADAGAANDTGDSTPPGRDIVEGTEGDDALRVGPLDFALGQGGADVFTVETEGKIGMQAEIDDFDPVDDKLVIVWDDANGAAMPDLALGAIQDAPDKAQILLDGVVVAHVTGAATLRVEDIELVAESAL